MVGRRCPYTCVQQGVVGLSTIDIVQSKAYIDLLRSFDPDGSPVTNADQLVAEMSAYAAPACSSPNKINAIAYAVAKDARFFWSGSDGSIYGIYTLKEFDYIVRIDCHGLLYVVGNSICNWVESVYGASDEYDINGFMEKCSELFGIKAKYWDRIYPDLDSVI